MKPWISEAKLARLSAMLQDDAQRAWLRRNVHVYPPDLGYVDETHHSGRPDLGEAWDRLIDAERLREFHARAFWACVRTGGCRTHRCAWSPGSAEETLEQFGRRWREAFARGGARRNGKQVLVDRFLEECRERNIPVEVHPPHDDDQVGVDVYPYSDWLNIRAAGGPSFFDRMVQKEADRVWEVRRRRALNRISPPEVYSRWRADGDIAEDVRRFREAARTTWPGEQRHEFVEEPDDDTYRRYFLNQYRRGEE